MIVAAVLISGTGSNLQAILDAIAAGRLDARVALVVSNRPDAAGLARAARAGVPTRVIEHGGFPSREAFDAAVVEALRAAQVELVVLAGFDRLVSRVLLAAFPQRVLNIHPALLPAFPGLHAQRQAAAYGVKIAGATVHFVDDQVDHGPIIVQGAVAIDPDDGEEAVRRRILEVEHVIYPLAIQLLAEGRVEVVGRHVRVRGARPQPRPPLIHW